MSVPICLSLGPGKCEHGVVKSLKALGCYEELLLGPHSHTQLSDMTWKGGVPEARSIDRPFELP